MIIALIFPVRVQAHEIKEVKIEYQTPYQAIQTSNSLYPLDRETVEKLRQAYAQAQPKVKKANYGSNYGGSCVTFAKNYLGIYGTWGDGGHRLSLNSGPVVGAVVIFQGTHVAVITAISGQNLTIIESNYDYRGHIRTRVISASSSSIKGYHIF